MRPTTASAVGHALERLKGHASGQSTPVERAILLARSTARSGTGTAALDVVAGALLARWREEALALLARQVLLRAVGHPHVFGAPLLLDGEDGLALVVELDDARGHEVVHGDADAL